MYILFDSTHLTIIVESICKKGCQAKLIENLSLCDYIFKTNLHNSFQYRKEKREIFTRGSILISITFLVKIIIATYAWRQKLEFAFMYPVVYSIFILRLRPIQITFFVYLLRNRLILIIEELKNIQSMLSTQCNDVSQAKPDVCHTENDSTFIRQLPDRLISLKRIYTELYDSCEQLNQAFGWSITIITMQVFVDFTSKFVFPGI